MANGRKSSKKEREGRKKAESGITGSESAAKPLVRKEATSAHAHPRSRDPLDHKAPRTQAGAQPAVPQRPGATPAAPGKPDPLKATQTPGAPPRPTRTDPLPRPATATPPRAATPPGTSGTAGLSEFEFKGQSREQLIDEVRRLTGRVGSLEEDVEVYIADGQKRDAELSRLRDTLNAGLTYYTEEGPLAEEERKVIVLALETRENEREEVKEGKKARIKAELVYTKDLDSGPEVYTAEEARQRFLEQFKTDAAQLTNEEFMARNLPESEEKQERLSEIKSKINSIGNKKRRLEELIANAESGNVIIYGSILAARKRGKPAGHTIPTMLSEAEAHRRVFDLDFALIRNQRMVIYAKEASETTGKQVKWSQQEGKLIQAGKEMKELVLDSTEVVKQNVDLRKKLEAEEKERKKKQAKVKELENELVPLQEEVAAKRRELTTTSQELEQQTAEGRLKGEELERLRQTAESQQAELAQKGEQILSLNERIGTIIGSHDQAIENERQTRGAAKTQAGELGRTSEALKAERERSAGLEEQLAAQKAATEDSEARARDADELRRETSEQKKTISSLKGQLTKADKGREEEALKSQSAKDRFNRLLADREEQLESEYEGKLRKERGQKKSLKEQLGARDERIAGLGTELEERDTRINELTEARAQLEEAQTRLGESNVALVDRMQGMYRITNGVMELIALISHDNPSEQEERYQSVSKELIGLLQKEEEQRKKADEKKKAKPGQEKRKAKRVTISGKDLAVSFSEFRDTKLLDLVDYVPPILKPGLRRLYEAQTLAADLHRIKGISPEEFMKGPEAVSKIGEGLSNEASRELLELMQQLYAASQVSVRKTPVLSARVRAEDTPQGKLYRSLLYNMIKVVSGNEWKALVGTDPSIIDYYKRDEFKDAAGIFAEFSKKIEESQAGKANEMQLELEKMAAELEEKDKAHAAYEEESEKKLGELKAASERVSGEYDAYKKDAGERIEGLNTRIGELEKKVAAIGEERDGLSAELKKKKTEDDGYVAKTSGKIQDLNAKLKQSQAEVAIANEERDGLQIKLEQARQEYEKEKEALEGKAAAASKEGDGAKGALEKARQGYEADRTDAEKRIDGLNTNIGELENKVAAIGKERDGLSAELKKKKDEDEAYVTKTSRKIQDLNGMLKQSKAEVAGLTKERDGLNGDLEKAGQKYENYRTDAEKNIEGLNTRIGGLEESLATTTNERDALAKEKQQRETAYEKARQAFRGDYSSRAQALTALDQAIALGLEEAVLVKQTYSATRKIIEQGEGTRSENNEAVRLLKSMQPKFNVATEINLFGSLEYAKWVAYKARKTEDHSERLKLYEDAKAILRSTLRMEPNFRGAQLYLDKYTSESALVEDNYARAMVIIRDGSGNTEENEEVIRLLMSIRPEANVSKPLGLVRNLEYAKSLASRAGRAESHAERSILYCKSVELLNGILNVDPNFRGARLYLDQYSIDATVSKKAAEASGNLTTF